MLESHWCCCPAPVLGTLQSVQEEAEQPLASPLAQTPIHPPELNTAPRRCSSCTPAPAGSRGCGAAAPPFSAHCTHPRAAELCVPPAMGHSWAPRAPHHSPMHLFQHNPSFQHKCYLTWCCSSACTIQSRCPRAKAPLSRGQHLHPSLSG